MLSINSLLLSAALALPASADPGCGSVPAKKVSRGLRHWILAYTGAANGRGGRPLKTEIDLAFARVDDVPCFQALRGAAIATVSLCAGPHFTAPDEKSPDGQIARLRRENSCGRFLLRRCGIGLSDELRKPGGGALKRQLQGLPKHCRPYLESLKPCGEPGGEPSACLAAKLESIGGALGVPAAVTAEPR